MLVEEEEVPAVVEDVPIAPEGNNWMFTEEDNAPIASEGNNLAVVEVGWAQPINAVPQEDPVFLHFDNEEIDSGDGQMHVFIIDGAEVVERANA
ncbi:hypothetical protein AMTR_s00062p00148240 [Amborella trichopoda]|uniref:Uncharacterized protein n=1 Tax=Amborella trichopoda TaxID=13333 RepID=U5D200_AMBTC|nr:hypothetical protein AMTR_s00062p00148240 [Amborella trichopoda]